MKTLLHVLAAFVFITSTVLLGVGIRVNYALGQSEEGAVGQVVGPEECYTRTCQRTSQCIPYSSHCTNPGQPNCVCIENEGLCDCRL